MTLIRQFAAICAAIGLAIGLWTGTAHAHNQDPNSLWGCAATRPSSEYSIDHSWWDGLAPGVAFGRCMSHNVYNGVQVCWRLTWYVDQGRFEGTGYDFHAPCWFSEP